MPNAFFIAALLDGAGAPVDEAVDEVELPVVVAAAVDMVEPVVVEDLVLADLALAVEVVEAVVFEEALLFSEDAAEADETEVAAVADALALGVIDSTVFVLSTTNCCV